MPTKSVTCPMMIAIPVISGVKTAKYQNQFRFEQSWQGPPISSVRADASLKKKGVLPVLGANWTGDRAGVPPLGGIDTKMPPTIGTWCPGGTPAAVLHLKPEAQVVFLFLVFHFVCPLHPARIVAYWGKWLSMQLKETRR